MKTVVGLFDDLSDARNAVDDLVGAGYNRNDISLIASDQDRTYSSYLDRDRDMNTTDTMSADMAAEQGAEGALAGALTGGAIGGLAGVLLGLGAIAIPGIGPIIAAGPIVAGLTGAGIGAVVGGLTGALVSWGIPEDEAGYYAEGIRRGGTLIGVKVDESRVDNAIDILNDHDPVDVTERSEFWRGSGWTSYDPNAPAYTAEQVAAERQSYYTDEYMDEDYNRYSPTFRQHYDTMYGTSGRDYSWYEPAYYYGYTLASDDRYRNYNDWNSLEAEARRGWETTEDSAQTTWEDIKDSVRHAWEEVKDAFTDDTTTTTTTSRMTNGSGWRDTGTGVVSGYGYGSVNENTDVVNDYDDLYRTHYDTTYVSAGRDYTYYEPAYRFGHDLASDEFYRDYAWMDIEPEVRRHWEESNQGTWQEFKDAVRYGWEQVKAAVS